MRPVVRRIEEDAEALRELGSAVEEIARRAGRAILEVYERSDPERADHAGPTVVEKGDGSPLTEADRRSEAVIRDGLMGLEPDFLIVSEEGERQPYAERARHERAWLCDPLDGTKEFLRRNGEFCVCVALCVAGAPVLGLIHAPVDGRSHLAWRGAAGVHVRAAAGGEWAVLRKRQPLDGRAAGLRVCVSRSHLSPATEAYLAGFDAPRAVPLGSALKFCAIAEDRIDLYPRLAPTMEWDTAAGQCLVEVAGGEVLDAESGAPLRYNKPALVNPHFVARAPLVDA